MSNENKNQQNQTEDQQTKQEKKERVIKFSWAMTGVVAISAAVGYAAGFATTKLLSK